MGYTEPAVQMNEEFDEHELVQYIKPYMFIKGFAVAKGLKQTLVALSLAQRLHRGQYRKGGMPYLYHPLKVCTAYKKADGTILKHYPASLEELAQCEPVYEEFEGFDGDLSQCKSFEELPE